MHSKALTLLLISSILVVGGGSTMAQQNSTKVIELSQPSLRGEISLEECLASRRSVREFGDRALTLDEISQLMWAAQGITSDWGGRTAPSAGALYPIRIFLSVLDVDGMDKGVWEYFPSTHSLELKVDKDVTGEIMAASLDQGSIGDAQAVIFITAVSSVTEIKYGDRSMRYIDQEVGAVCQNIYLTCESINLGTVAIGAFHDDQLSSIIESDNEVRLIMPVGTL